MQELCCLCPKGHRFFVCWNGPLPEAVACQCGEQAVFTILPETILPVSTTPTSQAYCYCWVEGLMVAVVIDETSALRTVRIAIERDPAADARPYIVVGP